LIRYTLNAAYTAGTLGESWQRGDENGAFYGAFYGAFAYWPLIGIAGRPL
jgi:hypothetical protein